MKKKKIQIPNTITGYYTEFRRIHTLFLSRLVSEILSVMMINGIVYIIVILWDI